MTEITKTQIYNVIILDASGSMNSVRDAALTGFNDILNNIKDAQIRYMDTQIHFVSLCVFGGYGAKHIYDKAKLTDAKPLSTSDYVPSGRTPLYDAMGETINSIQLAVKSIDDASVMVTVITDGVENASKEYTKDDIIKLIDELKEDGWSFTYMGSGHNASTVAKSLHIDQSITFKVGTKGTSAALQLDKQVRNEAFSSIHQFKVHFAKGGPQTRQSLRSHYSTFSRVSFANNSNNLQK